MNRTKAIFYMVIVAAILLGLVLPRACSRIPASSNVPVPAAPNSIEVSMIYAPEYKEKGIPGTPEYKLLLPKIMEDFNRAYAQGKNPLTGEPLKADERPIFITGKDGSSGTVMQAIVNAVLFPNNANVERPTIYCPSVSHWLVLANYQTGRELFTLSEAQPTGLAAVVMAIWESRLNAIKTKHPGQLIGWEELLEVMNDPNGWASYGIGGRTTVYYGHTDPYVSSTAISTLMAEFYASARYEAGQPVRRLTLEIVNDPNVQAGVRKIEEMIKHYSLRTTEFKDYISQGPDYLDFVALEENDLLSINRGLTKYKPPEKLVALYPKEGTFWHEHPFSIPNADWVTPEQREAAKIFTKYVLNEDVQKLLMEAGFRPANVNVKIGDPFISDYGVDPLQPSTVLEVPSPEVLAAVQASWQYVKKQADIVLLVDTTGSMGGDKLDQAKQAMRSFISDQRNSNAVGLSRFSTDFQNLVEIDSLEINRDVINQTIDRLAAGGNTALYDAILATLKQLATGGDSSRIKAILVLSDGLDNSSNASLNDVVQAISSARDSRTPVLVFPVAYGSDADTSRLNTIAKASDTKVQSGDPANIVKVLEIIASYF